MAQDTIPTRRETPPRRTGAHSRPTGRQAKAQSVSEVSPTREDDSLLQSSEEAQGHPLPDFLLDDAEAVALGITRPVNPISKLKIYLVPGEAQLAAAGALFRPTEQSPRMKRAIEEYRKRVRPEIPHTPIIPTRKLTSEDYSKFDSGNGNLNHYFQHYIVEDVSVGYLSAFIAVEDGTDEVAGYYTILTGGIPLDEVHQEWKPDEPLDWPQVPAAKMDNLAVARKFHGQGVETFLIADAVNRIQQSPFLTVPLLIIEAADDAAASIYRQLGMRQLLRTSGKYHAHIDTLASSIGSS